MDERELIRRLAERVPSIGDDCAVVPSGDTQLVLTTDMLWRETDLPEALTPYTIGWRTVAVSLSDVAAMGARPLGTLVALGAPEFAPVFTDELLDGILACCDAVGTDYLGGDLSSHRELTLVSSALGETPEPVMRTGARVGDLVAVTGELGRTAAALRHLKTPAADRANALFAFPPRIAEGQALAPYATSMMDVSDGLARSLHQLAEASGVGFRIEEAALPLVPDVAALATTETDRREMALRTGEDFELVATFEPGDRDAVEAAVELTVIGEAVNPRDGLVMASPGGEDAPLADRGYTHG